MITCRVLSPCWVADVQLFSSIIRTKRATLTKFNFFPFWDGRRHTTTPYRRKKCSKVTSCFQLHTHSMCHTARPCFWFDATAAALDGRWTEQRSAQQQLVVAQCRVLSLEKRTISERPAYPQNNTKIGLFEVLPLEAAAVSVLGDYWKYLRLAPLPLCDVAASKRCRRRRRCCKRALKDAIDFLTKYRYLRGLEGA